MKKIFSLALCIIFLHKQFAFAAGFNNDQLNGCLEEAHSIVSSMITHNHDEIDEATSKLEEMASPDFQGDELSEKKRNGYKDTLQKLQSNLASFQNLQEQITPYLSSSTEKTKREKQDFITGLFGSCYSALLDSTATLGDRLRFMYLGQGKRKFKDYLTYSKGMDAFFDQCRDDSGKLEITRENLIKMDEKCRDSSDKFKEEAAQIINNFSLNEGAHLDTYPDQIALMDDFCQRNMEGNLLRTGEFILLCKTLLPYSNTALFHMEDNPYLYTLLKGELSSEEEARVHKHRLYHFLMTVKEIKEMPLRARKEQRRQDLRKRFERQLEIVRKIEKTRWKRFNVSEEMQQHSIVPDLKDILVEEAHIWRPVQQQPTLESETVERANIAQPAPSQPTTSHFEEQDSVDPKEIAKRRQQKAEKKSQKDKEKVSISNSDESASDKSGPAEPQKRVISDKTFEVVKKLCRTHHDGQRGSRILDWDNELVPAFYELAGTPGLINESTGSSARQFVYGPQKYVIHKPHRGGRAILGLHDTNRAEEMFRLFGWTTDTLTDGTEDTSSEEEGSENS